MGMTKAERMAMLAEKLETMQTYERELRASGVQYVAGVDEVGRGPLAGPVVTACVIMPEDFGSSLKDGSDLIFPEMRFQNEVS